MSLLRSVKMQSICPPLGLFLETNFTPPGGRKTSPIPLPPFFLTFYFNFLYPMSLLKIRSLCTNGRMLENHVRCNAVYQRVRSGLDYYVRNETKNVRSLFTITNRSVVPKVSITPIQGDSTPQSLFLASTKKQRSAFAFSPLAFALFGLC